MVAPDLTEQKRRFIPSATLFQDLLDRDPAPVSVMDLSHRIVAINAAWRSIMGAGDEVLGLTAMELLQVPISRMTEMLEPVYAGHDTSVVYKAPGDAGAHKVVFSPWRDEAGEIAGVVSRFTVGASAHQDTEGHERRMSLAMDLAKVFSYEVDFRTGQTTCLPANLFGVGEVRILCFEDSLRQVPETMREAHRQAWERHLATGEPLVQEYPRLLPGGGVSWRRTVTESVRGADGEVTGLVGVTQIIDDQKQAELALVEEKEAAQAADRAKSEFLANMSHEIRTPLTSVIGFTDLLAKLDDLPPAAQTYVQRISSAGHGLLSVINDILDFSKLEAGQVQLDPHLFDPAACIEGVAEMLAPQAANKGIAVECDITAELPGCVEADSARIRQVLVNLVGNAIKFTEAGRVSVAVRYDRNAPAQLHVAVTDTGSGVSDEAQKRLFERFSQVDGTVSRRHGGTGLGLAICKSLVELMGGTLGVESRLGEGSTFWFTVPARPAAATEAPAPATIDAGLDVRPAHILLVDDLATNRELVRAMLAPFGHSFEEADNGADAVKAAMRTPFDLILMDLQMPGMDGIAASRAIRSTCEANRGTPILAFSANVLAEHTEAALAAGMNGHIAKPIQPSELLTKVTIWTSSLQHEEAVAVLARGA